VDDMPMNRHAYPDVLLQPRALPADLPATQIFGREHRSGAAPADDRVTPGD